VTFIYVGRLWEGKGLSFLLEAFSTLQRRTSEETSLLLVGDGPQGASLRAYCDRNGVKNVVFSGFHEGDMLSRLYGSADIFVFPTLGDPFGLVVLEAMACGLPIISTSTSGEIGDRVKQSVNGFIVAPGSTEQLLDRMTLLTRDAKLRESMGKASAERVAGQSPEMWAEAFESAVDEVVSLPRPKDFEARRPPDLHGVDTRAK